MGSEDKNVYALNAATGAKLWSYATGDTVDSSPAVASRAVFIGSADKNVYALDAATGAKLWSFATGSEVVLLTRGGQGRRLHRLRGSQRVCPGRGHGGQAVELRHRRPG